MGVCQRLNQRHQIDVQIIASYLDMKTVEARIGKVILI